MKSQLFCTTFFSLLLLFLNCAQTPPTATITVSNRVTGSVSSLLFGQFVERFKNQTIQEVGAELLIDNQSGTVREDAKILVKKLSPTVMRFPGGGDVEEHTHWTYLIDNAPERQGPRNKNNRFGIDEFLKLCQDTDAEAILVLGLREAVWRSWPLAQATQAAAALVAYVNGSEGVDLPGDLERWVQLRINNGHPEPYGIKYFQIGNEWNAWFAATKDVTGDPNMVEHLSWLKHCLFKYSEAIRSVDSSVAIIIDGVYWDSTHKSVIESVLSDPQTKKHADLAALHFYKPWDGNLFQLNGTTTNATNVDEEVVWNACVSTPCPDTLGFSQLDPEKWDLARKYGWRVAITEWNWNGWGQSDRITTSLWTKAVGAAGFIHAMIRQGEHIELATQSMLAGNDWDINSIRIPDSANAYVHPTAQITSFYKKHHGQRLLDLNVQTETMNQPVRFGDINESKKVALIDAVATGTDNKVYVHIINRTFAVSQQLKIDLNGFSPKSAVLHCMTGELNSTTNSQSPSRPDIATVSHQKIKCSSVHSFKMLLPERSVSILEVYLQ